MSRVIEVPVGQFVPITPDHLDATTGTIGRTASLVMDIAEIDVVEPVAQCNVACPQQGFVRRPRLVPHAVVGMKGREM